MTKQDDVNATQREILAYMIPRLSADDGICVRGKGKLTEMTKAAAHIRGSRHNVTGISPNARFHRELHRSAFDKVAKGKALSIHEYAVPSGTGIVHMLQ